MHMLKVQLHSRHPKNDRNDRILGGYDSFPGDYDHFPSHLSSFSLKSEFRPDMLFTPY